jgi:uncharacterized protein (TIGR03086 family)
MTAVPDLRPQLSAAYEQAIATASAVRPDQLGNPTPCTAMDVAGLLDHTVFAARRAAALGRGEVPTVEPPGPHIEFAQVPAALREAGVDARAAWADDASLERIVTMPWGETYPGAALVGIYLVELATHSWDIAVATGNTGLLDDNLGSATLACAESSIRPDYRNAEGNPFGPEVPAPPDASVWERLAAFMGRQPRP